MAGEVCLCRRTTRNLSLEANTLICLGVLKAFRLWGIIAAAEMCGGIFLPEASRTLAANSAEWHPAMPKTTIDFDTVRKIGLALPGVEEGMAYGSPALKVRGKLLACVPVNRTAEPGSLVVRVEFDDRAELLAAAPDVYYLTDHYVDYNGVLVRLSRVDADALRDLLRMAHKFVTAKRPARAPSPRGRKRAPRAKRGV